MFIGYSFILMAAVCWGLSATWAKHLIVSGNATPLLLSQTRVMFAWLILFAYAFLTKRDQLRIAKRDLLRFCVLGIVGIAGANFFLYQAIGQMNAALADLIQFTAPIMVVLWMWARKQEGLGKSKIAALALSVIGCALALNITSLSFDQPPRAVLSAFLSALCFATVLILGKSTSAKYPLVTYLNYALLAATVFWLVIIPPGALIGQIKNAQHLATLIIFSVTSILLPYTFFFLGLQRVPASRASIVSTFEPVVVALGSWLLLSESLTLIQILGMLLVCSAIVIVETTSNNATVTDDKTSDHNAL